MNCLKKYFRNGLLAVPLSMMLGSCAMESPFADSAEGSLTLTTQIRSDIKETRGVPDSEMATLREKCVVYIENAKGVIRKFKGLDNVPESIRLRTGSYLAEAWSGDSVSASFDSKFYRGYQKFEMTEGNNALTLRCNIANVIVSVDASSLDVDLNDLKVTFSHSRGSLVFDSANIPTAKGYFMMPNADKNLNYSVDGTKADGTVYSKKGVIEGVQRAHEYKMTITQEEAPVTEGGALIRLVIADIPVIDEEVEVFPGPAIRGVEFDMDSQVVSETHNFTDTKVYVRGYFGLSSLQLGFSDNFQGLVSGQNLLEGSVASGFASRGITVERRTSVDPAPSVEGEEVTVEEAYITFSKTFLDQLPASDSEYVITITAVDGRHMANEALLRIANDPAAVEHLAPVGTAPAPDPVSEPMAVLATRATLKGYLYDAASAGTFGLEYRKSGASEWIKAYPSAAQQSAARRILRKGNSSVFEITLEGLQPGTAYQYRAFCDGFTSPDTREFTTESPFIIPNASFESWGAYQAANLFGKMVDVVLPGAENDKFASFWGSGNEGAVKANLTLTDKSTDMVHSGQFSARLESKTAVGVLASGNIFVGYYAGTDGTDGILSLGRPYNGSHPAKVKVYANYRPGNEVSVKSGNEAFVGDLQAGAPDHGQIYVALTDEPVEIRTKASNRKLFDPEDPHVLAYGQVTWKDNFGPDGALKILEIPFEYFERARSKAATHLVIVAAASKYGDFFSGSKGSVMYLDDFELVYE